MTAAARAVLDVGATELFVVLGVDDHAPLRAGTARVGYSPLAEEDIMRFIHDNSSQHDCLNSGKADDAVLPSPDQLAPDNNNRRLAPPFYASCSGST